MVDQRADESGVEVLLAGGAVEHVVEAVAVVTGHHLVPQDAQRRYFFLLLNNHAASHNQRKTGWIEEISECLQLSHPRQDCIGINGPGKV